MLCEVSDESAGVCGSLRESELILPEPVEPTGDHVISLSRKTDHTFPIEPSSIRQTAPRTRHRTMVPTCQETRMEQTVATPWPQKLWVQDMVQVFWDLLRPFEIFRAWFVRFCSGLCSLSFHFHSDHHKQNTASVGASAKSILRLQIAKP